FVGPGLPVEPVWVPVVVDEQVDCGLEHGRALVPVRPSRVRRQGAGLRGGIDRGLAPDRCDDQQGAYNRQPPSCPRHHWGSSPCSSLTHTLSTMMPSPPSTRNGLPSTSRLTART